MGDDASRPSTSRCRCTFDGRARRRGVRRGARRSGGAPRGAAHAPSAPTASRCCIAARVEVAAPRIDFSEPRRARARRPRSRHPRAGSARRRSSSSTGRCFALQLVRLAARRALPRSPRTTSCATAGRWPSCCAIWAGSTPRERGQAGRAARGAAVQRLRGGRARVRGRRPELRGIGALLARAASRASLPVLELPIDGARPAAQDLRLDARGLPCSTRAGRAR